MNDSKSSINASEDNNNDKIININNEQEEENRIEKLVNKNSGDNHLKNLYENIGTRVSKLREINDNYEQKIKEQEKEIKLLDDQIKEKRYILEHDMRGQGGKKDEIKLHDSKWVNDLYQKLLEDGEIKMQINQNHIQNDPALKKAYQQKESELSQLKNHLNNLIKKTEHIKNEINILRIENNKHQKNLDLILDKKEKQNKEMNKISEEANRYLLKKGTINEELIKLNKKIDQEKIEHESKMQELTKMIDNTKKIKEFHETLAFEKFSNNNTYRQSSSVSPGRKPTSKMAEEQQKLKDKEIELINTKKKTAHLNFCKPVLLKKQSELNKIIEKVKKETGIDNLDKLSSDLQLSTKTNSLFEKDLANLEMQKQELEKNIEIKKKEIQEAYSILNDTSTKKNEYMAKLEKELKDEEEKKDLLNRRLYSLNRMIELMSKGFKNICEKLNFFDPNLKFDSDTPEGTLTKCMDFLERKMVEIIQLNTDPLKETISADNDETKQMIMMKKISEAMNKKDHLKMIDKKKITPGNFSFKEIKDISNDIVNSYLKKYEKMNENENV